MFYQYAAASLLILGIGDRLSGPESQRFDESNASLCRMVTKALVDQDDSLHAASLVYRQRPPENASGPPGSYTRRFVAAARPGYFLRDNGHGHGQMRLSDDPYRKILLITPVESLLFEHLNRVLERAEVEHSGPAPDELAKELIFRAWCWWPYTGWSPPQVFGRPWSMRTLLGGGGYRLRPEQDLVGDRACHVLELAGVDVIWVDRERPSCVLRRDVYNPATRCVASRFEMGDYREVGDGILLPGSLVNRQFDSNATTPLLRSRVVIEAFFSIEDVKVNGAVDTQTFKLDLGPGTVRRVVSGGQERLEPIRAGQVEHFDSILAWSREHVRRPDDAPGNPAVGIWAFAVIGSAAMALGLALTIRLQTRRTSARSARGLGDPKVGATSP